MAKKKKKSAEELSMENELLKLKMMAEFGGDFVGSENLPPEVESQFLKQINRFHKLHESAEMIKIYDFLGAPPYNHVLDMGDKEISRQLKKFKNMLRKKGILVDTLSGVSDREMYRFVTEELFKHEIQNIRMPNWTMHMIYEEFHPSDEFDIKSQCSNAISLIFDKLFFSADFIFAEEMKNSLGLGVDRDEVLSQIDTFKIGFNQIRINELNFTNIDISEDKKTASAVMTIDYATQSAKGRRFKQVADELQFSLIKDEETNYWMIEQVVFEKLGL